MESTRAGTQVVQRTCDAQRTDQQWQVRSVGNNKQFVSVANNDCLDVEGASANEGAHVKTFDCKTTNNLNQQWVVRSTARGTQLAAVHSQRCLNVAGADSADGARFVQGDCGDREHQLFDLRALNSQPVFTGSSSTNGGEPFVGEWRWFNGSTITMRADGNVQGNNNQKGRWTREPSNRYVITWSEGWIDRLVLSSDNRKLQGSNQNGTQISAERIGSTPNTPSTPGNPSGNGVSLSIAKQRDCGTGADDSGCSMQRGNQYPMDADALQKVLVGMRMTPVESRRIPMAKSLVGSQLLTAQQLGQMMDELKSEPLMIDLTRELARSVVDPKNLDRNSTKFRNVLSKASYTKAVADASNEKSERIEVKPRENSGNRLDLRRR